ncbi:hypothetical protein [Methanogenium cariaci]|uniref:hypothetical protein n=1 Tax=Methanogenium cariaci TaxID=2197 RepID=UPI001C441A6B|nr:hypothetical protein [Methanogenium cariaci]
MNVPPSDQMPVQSDTTASLICSPEMDKNEMILPFTSGSIPIRLMIPVVRVIVGGGIRGGAINQSSCRINSSYNSNPRTAMIGNSAGKISVLNESSPKAIILTPDKSRENSPMENGGLPRPRGYLKS